MELQKIITDQLCKNTIFEGLTPQQISSILPCIAMNIKSYSPQECVCDKGEPINSIGVVLDGELCICNESPDGRRTTVANIEKNGLFGEAITFSTDSLLPHRVIAQNDAQVLYLSGEFFLMPCDKSCDLRRAHQVIVQNMLRLLSDRAIMLNKKIAYLTASDLRTKIAMYLCELYELNQSRTFNMPLNRDRLAEFFAVARPSLSRELVNLKTEGIIDFYRSSVKILDTNALYRIAEG